MSQERASLVLRVSPEVLVRVEGKSVLDRHGRILTWSGSADEHGEISGTVSFRWASLWERLRWALRPEPLEIVE